MINFLPYHKTGKDDFHQTCPICEEGYPSEQFDEEKNSILTDKMRNSFEIAKKLIEKEFGKIEDQEFFTNQPDIHPIICCGREVKNGLCRHCGKEFKINI